MREAHGSGPLTFAVACSPPFIQGTVENAVDWLLAKASVRASGR